MTTTPCGCQLCVPYQACFDCCPGWGDYEDSLRCRATSLAWSTLRLLTGGRVGNCPVTMRPCLTDPCDVCSNNWLTMQPTQWNGAWYNQVCGRGDCSCTRLCEILMPGPVAEITEVSLDGIVIDPTLFRLDNGNLLLREDGECWPSCQDMGAPLGDPCTLGITYVPGVKPGAEGEWAAGLLACEFAKACTGGKCRLPSAVTAISRNGTTMEMTTGLFANNITGIREVDAYVASINPYSLRTPPRVWSPDLPQHRYSTAVS